VPSYGGALGAVSRVSKLPTWTRTEAATCLAGSPGTGTDEHVSGPYDDQDQWSGSSAVGGRGLRRLTTHVLVV